MKVRYFVFLTLVIGIVSEIVHPNIKTWVPISLTTYIICGFLAVLAIYFCKKKREKCIGAIIGAVIVYVEYAVITAIAYLRMADTIIADGPVSIVASIVVAIILAVIAFWYDCKQRLYKK